ncbi:MAG: nucleotidyltransferase family protein [Nitrospirae bacterium]|nr:nucleotidyltransferase family protein [Nitrospirota bacterium]MBI5696820.1 nucleotidyltransferase family protein [Nitrospirota bacterium]
MKDLEEIKGIIAGQKGTLKSRFMVSEIGVFGSCVRGEARKKSDVDILVSFGKPVDFIEFIRLENYLAELLGAKVDLVTKGALKPRIGKRILDEVVYI